MTTSQIQLDPAVAQQLDSARKLLTPDEAAILTKLASQVIQNRQAIRTRQFRAELDDQRKVFDHLVELNLVRGKGDLCAPHLLGFLLTPTGPEVLTAVDQTARILRMIHQKEMKDPSGNAKVNTYPLHQLQNKGGMDGGIARLGILGLAASPYCAGIENADDNMSLAIIVSDNILDYERNSPTELFRSALDQFLKVRGGDSVPRSSGRSTGTGPPGEVKDGAFLNREFWQRERALGVDDYAKAIGSALDHAQGEVTFAVFGHWGRGKTFLLRRLEGVLPYLSHRYKPVWFSAWKYRALPELWVYLYETLVAACLKGGFLAGKARTVRANVHRLGHSGLVWGLFLLAFSIFPSVRALGKAWPYLVGAFGVYGLTRLILMLRSARSRISEIFRYFQLSRHGDKLGLQALIGDDLRALLKGWIPRPDPDDDSDVGVLYFFAVLFIAASAFMNFLPIPKANVPEMLREYQINAAPYVGWTLAGAWVVVAAIVAAWVNLGGKGDERILLIVDDLDRCPPDQCIEVIESLKLLLEDPEVSRRVQVVMLMEESVLHHAILEKYECLLRKAVPHDPHPYTPERIIQENLQKLFIAHLRLPPLSEGELQEIFGKYVDQTTLREELKIRKEIDGQYAHLQTLPHTFEAGINLPDERPRRVAKAVPDRSDPRVVETEKAIDNLNTRLSDPQALKIPEIVRDPSGILFGDGERRALLDALPILQSGTTGPLLGPRALQSFLFRYQLARVLLKLRGIAVDPAKLASELAEAVAAGRPQQARTAADAMASVIAEVS
jgi:hypothetical protein